IPSQTTQTAINLVAGTYNVSITDANACNIVKSITLTQPSTLTATASSPTFAGGYNISCNGGNNGSISATPSGGTAAYTYSWINGKTTSSISSLTAGVYTVTVKDANLCATTVTMTLTDPPALSASTSSP